MEILDAHQHFWRPERGDYGWLSAAPEALKRDFMPDDLHPLLQRFGVGQTILVQAAPTEAETDFLLDLAQRTQFVAGVVGWLDMDIEAFPDRLAHYARAPKFVGLRPMLQDLPDDDWILKPRVLENLAQVAASGVAFDLLVFPRHLRNAATAIERTPGLRLVVDHLAKPPVASGERDRWREDIARLASFPNVFCKLSGLVTEAAPGHWTVADLRPYVEDIAALFGPDRLIFGSDWPVCTLAAGYGEVLAAAMLALPSNLWGDERIFGANARRFYRLPPYSTA